MKKVRGITLDELDKLGIDEDNSLYWDKQKLVIEKKLSLRGFELFLASIASLATLVSAIISILEYYKNCN